MGSIVQSSIHGFGKDLSNIRSIPTPKSTFEKPLKGKSASRNTLGTHNKTGSTLSNNTATQNLLL
jgi:hypothetical protein